MAGILKYIKIIVTLLERAHAPIKRWQAEGMRTCTRTT